MIDPSLTIQKSLQAAVKAATLASANAGRVYDRVPQGVTFPFVHIGEDQLRGDYENGPGWVDVTSTIHVFSRAVGKPEVKAISGNIRVALDAGFALEGCRIAEGPFTDVVYMTDPDGLTEHAVITVSYKVIPTE